MKPKCLRCSKPLNGRQQRRFCSPACSNKFRQKHPDGFTCPVCLKAFQPPRNVDLRHRRFCGRACYLASHRAQTVTKTCPACGKDFSVPIVVANRYTVCSQACRHALTTYRDCPRCGKRFCDIGGLRRFCSEACRRPAKMIRCPTCRTSFRVCPGAGAQRQFCSIACYRRHRGENRLERAVRLELKRRRIGFVQEAKVGRYSIDFLLPARRIALEVDGAYWHRDRLRDARKEAWLRRCGWCVLRLREADVTDLGARKAVARVLAMPEQGSLH